MPAATSAAAAYLLITLALFHGVVAQLTTAVYADVGDPLLNTAILAWNARHLPLSGDWWNFPSFAPLSGVTAFTEHLLLTYPVASPIIWLTGNAVLAYNVVFLAAPVLNALAAYCLVRELTGSAAAAFIGGAAFAFSPYQAVRVSHLQTMMAFGMPIALLGLHRYAATRSRRGLVLFGVGWFVAGLSNAYLLAFFPIVVGLWCAWFVRRWRVLGAVVLTAALASAPLVAILGGYQHRQSAYGLSRGYGEIREFSADIGSVAGVSARSLVWSHWLPTQYGEAALFPGVTILGLTLVSVVTRRRRAPGTATFYVAAVAVLWLVAIGPQPQWGDWRPLKYGPYRLVVDLPLVKSIRVTARAWMPATLCLAVTSGLGVAFLLSTFPRRRAFIVAAIGAAMLAEGWFVDEVVATPSPMRAGIVPADALVLDLPIGDLLKDTASEYRAVLGGYRVINGYSGYKPPHYDRLLAAVGVEDASSLDAYRRLDDLYVVIRHGSDTNVEPWIAGQPASVRLLDVGEWVAYRLPRIGSGARLPLALPASSARAFEIPSR